MDGMVSVVVPVYNSEKHLAECIDSIISQSYTKIELILIDDGSFDSSPLICQKYVEKDSRVKYFRKENGGVSSARNMGIQKASGEYIMFCDSDDWLDNNAIELLIANMTPDIDMVVGQIENVLFDGCGNCVETKRSPYNMSLRSNAWNGDCFEHLFISSCAKLYRISSIKNYNIQFNYGQRLLEDMKFVFDYLSISAGWISIDNAIYKYRVHIGIDYIAKRQAVEIYRDVDDTLASVKKYFTCKKTVFHGNLKNFFYYQYNLVVKNMFWSNDSFGTKRKTILRLAEYIKSDNLVEGIDKKGLTRAEQWLYLKNSYFMYWVFNYLALLKHGSKVKGTVTIQE